jgi:seryl-tRNA synthetase
MLPIKLIRENPQYIKEIYKKRNYKFSIDKVIKLDEEKRNITFQVDDLRANRRRSTKKF